MNHTRDEEGQSIILVVLAMGIFLIGAVGLGFDGSHLYSERMKAQLAADAAAQAGILSIFDGTNALTGNAANFPTTPFSCSSYLSSTPCKYASYNGFTSPGDTISVSFPTSASGVTLSTVDPANLITVTVSRDVPTTLMRLLGPTFTTISATATAAIVSVKAPVPILVTHPTLDQAFLIGGNGSVKICGGPNRSIQVNSGAGAITGETGDAFAPQGNGGGSTTIDLTHAGTADDGHCNTGTGADMGVWGLGNPSSIGNVTTGSGAYIAKASPIEDPLAGVIPPTNPGFPGTQNTTLAAGSGICPSTAGSAGCTVLTPGEFPTGIYFTSTTVLVKPGIYYIDGSQTHGSTQYAFNCTSTCNMQMVTGTTDTTTGTGWDGTQAGGGALFYLTGTTTTTTAKNGKTTTTSTYGVANVGSSSSISLIGSPESSSYDGILFFEDHAAPALSDSLGGSGSMILIGTIYLTNNLSTMLSTPTQYQSLTLTGSSGGNTLIQGEIIVGQLTLQGTPNITMDLNPNSVLDVRKVAMVQ
jgi:hypothetical protein